MRDNILIEFYKRGTDVLITSVDVPLVPNVGDKICINEKFYIVGAIQWAVDYTERVSGRCLRACVELDNAQ